MKLSTAERARRLATGAESFPDLLGRVSTDDLLELVRAELGHEEILDAFQPHGRHFARAVAPRTLLHVVSGNTPHAGLQSLLRGLLLGSHNLCKLPSGGLVPELGEFCDRLPAALADLVELSETLPDEWLGGTDAVIVFGSDETVAALRGRTRANQIFVAHGHRISLGVILDDTDFRSIGAAARAVSLFDQSGCLSPQGFYVRGDARSYAGKLAEALAQESETHPRKPIPHSASSELAAWREEWRFRAANDPVGLQLWTSAGSTAWTVLYDGSSSEFTSSPLHRTVIVRPLPDDLRASLAVIRPFLSTVGLWPATEDHGKWLVAQDLGASRVCPIDQMQLPPLTWHQDGIAPLGSLVRWIDFEPGGENIGDARRIFSRGA